MQEHREQRVFRDHPDAKRVVPKIGANEVDYYPSALRADIDEANVLVYEHANNGVYRAGFTKTQSAYEEATTKVFAGLNWMDARLAKTHRRNIFKARRCSLAGNPDR